MIMLENQIPIFIFDQLLTLKLDNPDPKRLVAQLVLWYFDPLMPMDKPLIKL